MALNSEIVAELANQLRLYSAGGRDSSNLSLKRGETSSSKTDKKAAAGAETGEEDPTGRQRGA